MRRPSLPSIGYVAVLTVAFLVAMAAGWTTFGAQIDNDAYDFLFRLAPTELRSGEASLLAIDERTLAEMGGILRLRSIAAAALEMIQTARPKAVVIDIILADEGDPEQDDRLEAALARTPNAILAASLVPAGGWEVPLPRFERHAAAVGHAHADPDEYDNVTRRVALEKAAGTTRYWALSLEALRLVRGAHRIVESPEALEVDGVRIPAPRLLGQARPLYVRYPARDPEAPASVPLVTVADLRAKPWLAARFQGKVVFLGVTAQSAADDNHMTPSSGGRLMPGVEIHALAYETLRGGRFLVSAKDSTVFLSSLALAAAAGLAFAWLSGGTAYLAGFVLIAAAHTVPYALFRLDVLFAYAPLLSTAWLSVVFAATYQHFVVRRRLARSETARSRYQQAIHFVTHEMRSPLTAIQGSSELMGRYKLPEDKSRQLAQMIHSESKRLARMIQTFLDVERLGEGQMELKREPFQAADLVRVCLERVRPLAERKQIAVAPADLADASLVGDRELMEYAVYNLLNNAVKYSPAGAAVQVFSRLENGRYRLSVQDEGIGMDEKELANIFKKFYRTKKAEASGEAGTGIGLSIVDQIVAHHGGCVEVTSRPGAGSCFTIVLPAQPHGHAP